MNQSTENSEVISLRTVINDFLQERLQAKLDKLKEDDPKRQPLIESFKPENWIPDAAHRAGQIKQITHGLKFTHPDAKGSSLNSPGNNNAGALQVASHTLEELTPDVVGNAAALDVYKFLRLTVNNKSLLSRAITQDPALQQALPSTDEQKKNWIATFANLVNSSGEPSSHKLAKQVYWPMGNGKYHLLAPLFPTSLVHKVWQEIREDRFSDQAKDARAAHRAKKHHPHGYHEYPKMVIQQFGGTKPQNISQLNSQRYGENYLLRSCPPDWVSTPIKPPLRMNSVFDGLFGHRPRVRKRVNELRRFLYRLHDKENNLRIRNKREELVGDIIEEMLQFAAELRELEGDWSASNTCQLNQDEQCWFNPERVHSDAEFAKIYTWGDWKQAVCERFANWLNGQLIKKKNSLPFAEDEAKAWENSLNDALKMLRMEMDYE